MSAPGAMAILLNFVAGCLWLLLLSRADGPTVVLPIFAGVNMFCAGLGAGVELAIWRLRA